MIKYLKLLLWPFSLAYAGVTAVRNYMYDQGIKPGKTFGLPVIAVGNLTVGGTGKTPHVEYLLRLLHRYRVATLSRGYKRKSKGFILAEGHTTAEELGDEPFQYHVDFPGVSVAVSEKRVPGIEQLLINRPEIEVVVLDDAMQHRAVQPSLNIMLTDYGRLFYKDFVLPAGLLRESRAGASRADMVIVSKCPDDLTPDAMAAIANNIQKYAGYGKRIFFSRIKYGSAVAFGSTQHITKKVVLLAGIANPKPLHQYLLKQNYEVQEEFIFPDHHEYSVHDLAKVKDFVDAHKSQDITIITTRKDAVKLTEGTLESLTLTMPFFYLPIEVDFVKDGDLFDAFILEHIKKRLRR
ncbi:tetraacyldisaccharide 4'-kinase [Pontibacter sp. MBLB2868]|uniref:tetraacyldisaccharide 4'-kinase n=1 Tax=Pontibacter sp. MBLB2868 TaxID=3451555 RepID=UPI003F74F8C1